MAVPDLGITLPRRPRWMRLRRLLRAIAGPRWAPQRSHPPRRPLPVGGLDECPACRRDMVCPIHWRPVDGERWEIELRCGECGLARDVVASNAQAAAFDDTLDTHQWKIERELHRLDAVRMAEQIDAFVEALGRDLIGPADFAG